MPGLLDFLNTDDGKLGIALLSAAGPSMQPMGFGQRLQGAMQSLDAGKLEQMKMGLVKSQIDENTAQAQQRQQALQLAQRKQAALPGILGVTGAAAPGPIQPQTLEGTAMFSQPVGVGQVPQQSASGINVAAALQAGFTPEEIAKLDSLRNIGRDKVARTIKATGPDGKEYETQYDEFGRPVGAPMAQYRAPLSVNQGNQTTYLDPYTLQRVAGFQTFQSPDSAASVAATMRGQNLTDARAREQIAMGKVPAGYRQTADGGLEFIPGGPADPNSAKKAAPTEFQGKSTTFAARMMDSARVIDSLQPEVSPSQVAQAGYRPNMPNWLPGGQILSAGLSAGNKLVTPEKAQQFRQAQENWVTANLRQESGAAIGKDEMEKDIAKWFPQPGEPASVIAQKAAARKVAERAMVVQAGPGATSIPSILGTEPAAAAAPPPAGGAHFRYENGKLVKVQ